MTDLFSTATLGSLRLPNRFVRSATWEGLATDQGEVTEHLTELLCRLVRGNVGLIIPGHAYVSAEGQAGPWQLGVHHDSLLPGLQKMCAAVHDLGGVLVLQLAHAGAQSPQKLTGLEPVGPSVISNAKGRPMCREATHEDMARIKESFAQAAGRAKRAGFDGVQLHAAHGYLLSQWLSPHYNRRDDEHGGGQAERTRFVAEVVQVVRDVVGPDYPVLAKINASDFLDDGLDVGQMIESATVLVAAGLDAIELSGGTPQSGKLIPVRPGKLQRPEQEGYYRDAAGRLRSSVQVPVILVGGIRSLETARQVVEKGTADLVSMSRPLIREPFLIRRWQEGDATPSRCISDNGCFGPVRKGKGLYCTVEMKETGRKFVPFPTEGKRGVRVITTDRHQEGDMQELARTLVEDVQKRGGDPFSMAYELTKIYAGSGEPEAKDIPGLFLELYGLFLTGSTGGSQEGKTEGKKPEKGKDKEKAKAKKAKEGKGVSHVVD